MCARPEYPADRLALEGNDALNNMRASIDATFKAVEAREMGLTGQFVGFRPGALYAHIYARDSATIAPTAQYFYQLPWLTRPVEEFLALQYDGEPGDRRMPAGAHPELGAVSGTIGGNEISGAKCSSSRTRSRASSRWRTSPSRPGLAPNG